MYILTLYENGKESQHKTIKGAIEYLCTLYTVFEKDFIKRRLSRFGCVEITVMSSNYYGYAVISKA